MRDSSRLASATLCVSALIGCGCAPRTIVVVDPYPCPDGGPTGCPPGLLDDLVGFWRLNDPGGSTTARDSSGWSNDGTLVGLDPSTAWVAGGPEGSALSAEGQGYANVPASASIDSIANAVTVAAWIFLQGTVTNFATAISRQIGTSNDQHYHLSVNPSGQANFFVGTPTAGQIWAMSPMTVPLQTWVHLAGTYDGSTTRLYVNGTEVASRPVSGQFASEANPVILAGNGNGSAKTISELVPGLLDDIMLYRRALGADEVSRIAGGALLPSTGTRSDGGPSGD